MKLQGPISIYYWGKKILYGVSTVLLVTLDLKPKYLQTQKISTDVSNQERTCILGIYMENNPYPLRRGDYSSPASHPCTVSFDQGPAAAIPPGWSPKSHPQMIRIPEIGHLCSNLSNQNWKTWRSYMRMVILFTIQSQSKYVLGCLLLHCTWLEREKS